MNTSTTKEMVVLANRFELREQIGKGGMGAVHLGYDRRLKRKVAVKEQSFQGKDKKETEKLKKRFMREAEAIARLNHPYIVGVYDLLEEKGKQYLVMEHLDGLNLQQTLKFRHQLPAIESALIVANICEALIHIHEHHIIHRDIKPANIILSEDGIARLVDFGIMKDLEDPTTTTTGVLTGSIPYMSPKRFS